MNIVSFPLLSQLLLGFLFILFIVLAPLNNCANTLNTNQCNSNYLYSHRGRITKRRYQRIQIVLSFLLFSSLSFMVSAFSFESYYSQKKLISSNVRKFIQSKQFTERSFPPLFLCGNIGENKLAKIISSTTLHASQNDLGKNEKQFDNEILSLWEEKERLYEGLEEDITNACDHCNNRESCKSIIHELERNQMINEWNKVTGKDPSKALMGGEEGNSKDVDKNRGQSSVKSIWMPLLNTNHLKAGDLIPIDLDLQELRVSLINQKGDQNDDMNHDSTSHKKHLLLAVGDSIIEEEISIIDNISPLLMLPVNIYDIANQYRNTIKKEEQEAKGNQVKVACKMKEGKGSFRLRKSDDKYIKEKMEGKVTKQYQRQNYEKKKAQHSPSIDAQIKSIMYNGKEYYYYEDTDDTNVNVCSNQSEADDVDLHSYFDHENSDDFSQNNHLKDSLYERDAEEYYDEDAKNGMLPFFPSLSLGPMVNRCTSVQDFNERVLNSKKNSFLASIQMYKLRINKENILEVYLGEGEYTS